MKKSRFHRLSNSVIPFHKGWKQPKSIIWASVCMTILLFKRQGNDKYKIQNHHYLLGRAGGQGIREVHRGRLPLGGRLLSIAKNEWIHECWLLIDHDSMSSTQHCDARLFDCQTGEEEGRQWHFRGCAMWSLSMSSEPMLIWSSFPFICPTRGLDPRIQGESVRILTQLHEKQEKCEPSAYKGRWRGEPKDIRSSPAGSRLQ